MEQWSKKIPGLFFLKKIPKLKITEAKTFKPLETLEIILQELFEPFTKKIGPSLMPVKIIFLRIGAVGGGG